MSFFERYPRTTLVVAALAAVLSADFLLGWLLIPAVPSAYNPHYHHDYHKLVRVPRKWGDVKYEMVTNSLGFKDADTRIIGLSSDKRRILFLGDSFTEGIGYPYGETFVGLFASSLDSSRYEVLNAAMIAYSPKLYYLKLKYLLETLGLKIDEVFVFLDISDIQDEVVYDFTVPAHKEWSGFGMRLYAFAKRHSATVYFLDRMGFGPDEIRVSRAVRRELLPAELTGPEKLAPLVSSWRRREGVYYSIRPHWLDDEREYRLWGARGLALCALNMEELHQLCKKHGIKLSMAVYPWPDYANARFMECRQVSYWRAFAAKRGIGFLNLFPAFVAKDKPAGSAAKMYFIPGDGHFNAAGHKLVAGELIKFFK